MKTKFYVGFILFSVIFSSQIMAKKLDRHHAPQGIRESYIKCINQPNIGTYTLDECQDNERDYQEPRLNRTYQRLLKVLDTEQKKSLVLAQRAWLKFGEKEEDFQSTGLLSNDMSAESNMMLGEWKLYRTCARANQLEQYLIMKTPQK